MAGRGMPADPTEAIKWHIIAKAGGASDPDLDVFAAKQPADVRDAAQKEADKWLSTTARRALDGARPRGHTPRAMLHSALLNVMIAAARKAARALKRDFGEVEKLQVSLKGPANFVTAADRRAEETLYQELSKARPGYGFLGEEGGVREGADKTPYLDRRSARRHHQFPARHSAIRHFDRARARGRDGRRPGLQSGQRRDVHRRARQRRLPQRAAHPRRRPQDAGRRRDRLRAAASRPRRARARHARKPAPCRNEVAGLRRFGAAALDLAWVAAGRLDGYWERDIKPWDIAAGIILVREAGGFVTDCDGGDDMLAKGHIVAGNEAIQKECCACSSRPARLRPRKA